MRCTRKRSSAQILQAVHASFRLCLTRKALRIGKARVSGFIVRSRSSQDQTGHDMIFKFYFDTIFVCSASVLCKEGCRGNIVGS